MYFGGISISKSVNLHLKFSGSLIFENLAPVIYIYVPPVSGPHIGVILYNTGYS